MKVFLTEELNSGVLSRYADTIQSAPVCWHLTVSQDHHVALTALKDKRWQLGTDHLYEEIWSRLADWSWQAASCQSTPRTPLNQTEQAMLAYGLWARLRLAYEGTELIRHSLEQKENQNKGAELEVIAADPYVRDAVLHRKDLGSSISSVRIHSLPGYSALWRRAREILAGKTWLHLNKRYAANTVGTRQGNQKTMAVFVFNRRDPLQPLFKELERRGWRVVCFSYGRECSNQGVIQLGTESSWRPFQTDWSRFPSWVVTEELLRTSPVSNRLLMLALSASWMTGQSQVHYHYHLLDQLRPQVVMTVGADVASMGLTSAADRLGIPSLFMAHGLQGRAYPWAFCQTASALFGTPCVETNQKDAFGAMRRGLVATGCPAYDAYYAGPNSKSRVDAIRRKLPSGTAHLVVFFVTYAHRSLRPLSAFAQLQRSFKMVADGLPKDAFLICKLHPAYEQRDICQDVLAGYLDRAAFEVVGEREFTTRELLSACDVAIGFEYSMVMRDAIVMGRPAIAIIERGFQCGENGSTRFNHPGSDFMGACWEVGTVAEFQKAVVALTRDPGARDQVLKRRKAYIDRFLFASDGCASQRVADLAEHLASGKASDCFVASIGRSLIRDGVEEQKELW